MQQVWIETPPIAQLLPTFHFWYSSEEVWQGQVCLLHVSLGPTDAWHNGYLSFEGHVFLTFISMKTIPSCYLSNHTQFLLPLETIPSPLIPVDAKPSTRATGCLTLSSSSQAFPPTCFTPPGPCSHTCLFKPDHSYFVFMFYPLSHWQTLPSQLWALSPCRPLWLRWAWAPPTGASAQRGAATHLLGACKWT